MSYDNLPTELKRIIIEYIDQADASYRRRRDIERRRVLKSRAYGRSTASFSRVNKECRQLALPYVITTLRASKAKHPIFEQHLLNTSAMNLMTTFKLDLEAQNASLPLIVLYILPHLPNLRRFILPNNSFLLSISPHLHAESELKPLAFTVSKLIEAARKVTEWDVQLSNGLDYESIIFVNPGVIRSFTAVSTSDEDFRLLGSDETTFSRQLARCSSLETLKLVLHNTSDTLPYEICHSDSLSQPYLFYRTLTSLELSVSYGLSPAPPLGTDNSLVHFASHFLNLRHLRLDGVDYSAFTVSSFTFPELVHLELLRMAEFDDLSVFLNGKDMPKLERLEVGIVREFDLDLAVSTTEIFNQVARALNRFNPTLKAFHVHHKRGITEQEMQRFKPMVRCEVYTSWRPGTTEVDYVGDLDKGYEEEEMMQGMSTAIEDLSAWTVGSMRKLQDQGDVKGMSDLWKELSGIDEYRKWMED